MAYSEKQKTELVNTICKEIEDGRSLRSVLKDEGMPSNAKFFEWIEEDGEKLKQYARAMEARADKVFEEIVEIADDQEGDVYEDADGNEQVNHNVINRARLRVDARKWVVARMNPKKYGDKSTTILEGGEKEIKISFNEAGN